MILLAGREATNDRSIACGPLIILHQAADAPLGAGRTPLPIRGGLGASSAGGETGAAGSVVVAVSAAARAVRTRVDARQHGAVNGSAGRAHSSSSAANRGAIISRSTSQGSCQGSATVRK